jgi:16S rRNA (guanine966-N2)-methyltransferase
VRQALFDVIAHADWAPDLAGARVIDLFAGSGALGFEALSRGAAFCLFVETEETARGVIRDNAEALDLFGAIRIHRRDATDLGARPGSAGPAFSLAFLDPPYAKGPGAANLGESALIKLAAGGWLAPGALAVWERAADEPDTVPEGYERLDARRWGPARVDFLRAPP